MVPGVSMLSRFGISVWEGIVRRTCVRRQRFLR
jgi:hypothetical protein